MVKIVNGNLLESEADIIAHQVNCSGVFNSGVAKSICEHDYGVYRDYLEFCKERTPSSLSGTVRYFQSNIDAKMYASLPVKMADTGIHLREYQNPVYPH